MKQRHIYLTWTRILPCILVLSLSLNIHAQSARSILDKTATVVGRPSGASANFTISSSKIGSTSGTIAIKGNKFHARTPQAMVWFDGKTQWSYLKKTNEVNISTPSQAQQMAMNPYTFITMYRSGYNLTNKSIGRNYQIRMVAQNKQASIQEMYILINKSNYCPVQVKMKQDNTWSTINISNFKAKNLPNSIFVFLSKDLPSAEIIDLR